MTSDLLAWVGVGVGFSPILPDSSTAQRRLPRHRGWRLPCGARSGIVGSRLLLPSNSSEHWA